MRKISYFYKVENKDRYKTANKYYFHAKSASGINYLFTTAQLKEAIARAQKNTEDLPKEEYKPQDETKSVGFVTGFMIGVSFPILAAILYTLMT